MPKKPLSPEEIAYNYKVLETENREMKERISLLLAEIDQHINDRRLMSEANEQIREELVKAKEKAEESNKLKTSLLSNLSHEFRTPMNGILGFAEILKESLHENDMIIMANNILRSGRRLLSTLNSILFLAELETDKVRNNFKPLHINTFILSNLGEFETKTSEKNIFIKTKFQDWRLTTKADSGLLRIALHHLLENAIKFTERGGITLETGKVVQDGIEEVFITVRDTGIGIEEANMSKIFEPFRQVSEGWGRFYEGNGLGLPICMKIMEILHGRMQVESKPGEGSGFSLFLPSIESDNHFHQNSPWASIHQNMERDPASLHEIRDVLIVEDNCVNKELMVVLLKKICNTEYASDGESAVSMASRKKYAAILMDINLGPGIDGLEATRQIRQLPAYQDVPIIAVTGYTLSDDKERLLQGGCSHYLPKPFDRNTIVNLVEGILYTEYSN